MLGTLVVELLGLSVPGPVLGMLLFLLVLPAMSRGWPDLEQVTRFFLANLSLLFVPAAVGIVRHLGLVSPILLQLLVVLLVSLLVGLVVTAGVFAVLARRIAPAREEELEP
ncbi:CidA/LrgA family protein [Marinobacterium aestuariivivens]|uniref:CidA/LrgA family protein n=1 Tax=Marinobacterium aestuariivivens TaxID=1698799 RepID=A0ABW1ZX98_9GAMM